MKNIDNYKRNIKNLEVGDTFAIKIKTEGQYFGRYLILYKVEPTKKRAEDVLPMFKVKITKDGKLPSTEKELRELENIKTSFNHFLLRYVPISDKETMEERKNKGEMEYLKPDEYDYLYFYYFKVNFKRGKINDEYIYLGNFAYDEVLENEIIKEYSYQGEWTFSSSDLVDKCLERYEDFNLKKSRIYSKEGLEFVRKYAEGELKIHQGAEKLLSELRNQKNANS